MMPRKKKRRTTTTTCRAFVDSLISRTNNANQANLFWSEMEANRSRGNRARVVALRRRASDNKVVRRTYRALQKELRKTYCGGRRTRRTRGANQIITRPGGRGSTS